MSSIVSIMEIGIVLLVETLVHMSHTKLATISIFILLNMASFCSRLRRVVDYKSLYIFKNHGYYLKFKSSNIWTFIISNYHRNLICRLFYHCHINVVWDFDHYFSLFIIIKEPPFFIFDQFVGQHSGKSVFFNLLNIIFWKLGIAH